MEADDLKLYSVIVGNGSGVLFQPMNFKYTYILTAKHNFFDKTPVDGKPDYYKEKADGTIVNIYHLFLEKGVWSSQLYNFVLKKGENYFPHKTTDIAILKINFIKGFDKIFVLNDYTINNDFYLCGFPDNKRDANYDNYPNQYTNHKISNKTSSINNLVEVRLNQPKTQSDINGMSGGGIFNLNEYSISIIGIQSQMTKAISPQNEIDFVPIKHLDEILNYPENADKLTPLLPPYMASFEFLKDKAFDISAGIDDDDISFTRLFLKNKSLEVIGSNITPIYIKDYFKERLLLNEKNLSRLCNEIIYITWLEFLTIINIAKTKIHNREELEELFSFIRLIYKDTTIEWQDNEFLKECINGNFEGLRDNGTVLIKTNSLPAKTKIEHYIIKKGSLVSNIEYLKQEYIKGKFGDVFIDDGMSSTKEFVFDKYNFMHFEYLKKVMLVEKSEDFKRFNALNKIELLQKLKCEYEKLFNL